MAPQRHDALAHTETTEAKPLFFFLKIGLFGRQLVLELAGKVIEEVVPTHAGTVVRATDTGDTVFHRTASEWTDEDCICLGVFYPRKGGTHEGL